MPNSPLFKELTDFFIRIGADQVAHTDKTYLAHAIGVHNDLKAWGCNAELCVAGLFHSIYGTAKFQSFKLALDRRAELQSMIGLRAEELCYLNCAMDRDVFDATVQADGPTVFRDRLNGQVLELTTDMFRDLCTLHLCDWLEQVPRCRDWDHRRAAYRAMADHVGGVAIESWERVFADATV
ncbi:MAG: hypothetical protein O3A00_20960 [Planctomycetota bacterium]|nr:hypothetical protein [Planctomycetota bacterium]